jgi:hypothetical protein
MEGLKGRCGLGAGFSGWILFRFDFVLVSDWFLPPRSGDRHHNEKPSKNKTAPRPEPTTVSLYNKVNAPGEPLQQD